MSSRTEGDPPPENTPPCIIAMINQKGGVGKTTSTVNLGAALAETGRRVCLIDLDPQAHLTLHLGVEDEQIERTVYDLLIDPEVNAADARLNVRPGMDAIFAEVDLAGAEQELAGRADRLSLLSTKFEPIRGEYDVVIMDCPPSLGLLTLNALAMADEVIVPMQAHFLALQGVGKLLETVGLVCGSVNPRLRVTGILLCMHEGQTTLAREVVADIDGFFEQARDADVPWRDCRVLHPAIRRNIKLAEAPSFGNTIFDYEPWCPGALDYRAVAETLAARWEPAVRPGVASDVEPPPASDVEPPPVSPGLRPGVASDVEPPCEPVHATTDSAWPDTPPPVPNPDAAPVARPASEPVEAAFAAAVEPKPLPIGKARPQVAASVPGPPGGEASSHSTRLGDVEPLLTADRVSGTLMEIGSSLGPPLAPRTTRPLGSDDLAG